jgi:hypothetical protein
MLQLPSNVTACFADIELAWAPCAIARTNVAVRSGSLHRSNTSLPPSASVGIAGLWRQDREEHRRCEMPILYDFDSGEANASVPALPATRVSENRWKVNTA